MLFNSIQFLLFYPLVFVLYWIVPKNKFRIQNILLLVASYYFYSCWDWRFVFLLAFSTLLDYFSGLMIHQEKKKTKRKFWLILSVSINLGFLGIFKYYNFFIESFADLLQLFGLNAHYSTLQVILPVGISFYTFHGLSYVFDIYNRKIEPTKNIVDYTLFVSFFPLLVAGPIERATHLLPQLKRSRDFTYERAVDGMRQILWGLFKKIVIADNCAVFVNNIFSNYHDQNGGTLLLGAIMFAFQIYGDFSGYSDIALGTARLLGFDLLKNFSYPYFSRDIAEFWRRWHISLSSWFKDYLYIPLGGSKGGTWMRVRNTFIIFLVSGFWHGANWTFIVWGGLNALYIMPSIILKSNRKNLDIVAYNRTFPGLKDFFSVLTTFLLASFAWVFFRAENMKQAILYISGIFSKSFFHFQYSDIPKKISLLVMFFLIIEWLGRRNNYALENLEVRLKKRMYRVMFYFLILLFLLLFKGSVQEFIYFQF